MDTNSIGEYRPEDADFQSKTASYDAPVDGDNNDPFSIENAPGVSLIVQMRIYDTLMALLTVQAPEKATALFEAHAAGKIVASLPLFNMEG